LSFVLFWQLGSVKLSSVRLCYASLCSGSYVWLCCVLVSQVVSCSGSYGFHFYKGSREMAKNRKVRYEFGPGARITSTPQEVGEALEEIRINNGELTTEILVEEASDEEHVLHKDFIWDDSLAAHRYRLVTARNIIKKVRVFTTKGKKSKGQYVHVVQKTNDGRATRRYEPVVEVVDNLDLFSIALSELQSKLESAIRAVDELREAAGSKRPGVLALIGITLKSLAVANSTVKKITIG